VLGGYQLLNIPAVLILTLFKNLIPAWSGYQGSKADLWLVFGNCIYISGIDIDIALSGIKLILPPKCLPARYGKRLVLPQVIPVWLIL
jgi:hypothetical protein